ncbi:MAG: methylated-DNA--[protein]-cysteine S-methyltransferase [Coleofasciculus sp. C1-SOL-03]|uniref:methylated-DNA--[protein]-cysteine S-methyltransferase n=1 Tax=Coleofasciculus sp. C1-SOL-03 TaxID=3069522 RepID=UPI0032F2529F
MYKPLQKKNSSWIPSTAQKKSKSPSKLGHFSIQPKPNQKSSQSPEIGEYSRDSADRLAANVMRSLEAKGSQETETPTVQPQSESRISVADVVGQRMPTLTPRTLTPLQRQLTVGQPGDKYEQEADTVAAKVVEQINSPTSQQSVQGKVEPVVEPTVMRDGGVGGGAVDASVEQSIQQATGGGQGLSEDVRQPMEQAFGADFSGVRVHTDGNANQLNRSLNARAFTTGLDIFFKQGEYNPGSRDGQELLAHELTHVVQQNGSHLQSKPVPSEQEQGSQSEQELQDTQPHGVLGFGNSLFLWRMVQTKLDLSICAVSFGNSETELLETLRQQYPKVELNCNKELLTLSVEVILNYLKHKQTQLNLLLDIQGTPFQQQVWQHLQTIPYGSTRTYQEIAQALNKPTATCAVAQACAKNPIALIIPCHRVVRTDGTLGGYRWGEERKKALLELEQTVKSQQETSEKYSLWTNSTSRRYFLIPNNQLLSPGNFTIRNLTNESKEVELKAITNWEITTEQAQPYIEVKLTKAWQKTKNALSTLTNLATAAQGKMPSVNNSSETQTNPIASFLGVSPQELSNNPNAIQERWQNIFAGFQDMLQAATSEDPAHLETARSRMESLREHLQAQGVEVDEAITELPHKLREKYHSSETDPNLQESSTKLKEATEQVEQSFTKMLETIKEGATKFQKLAKEYEKGDG